MENANGGKLTGSAARSGHDHSLADLTDADSDGAIEGDVLLHTGDGWVPGPAVPTGTIIVSGSTTAPPQFATCIGSTVSRTTYSELFAVIGTRYGTGDGSTTFRLPHCTGTFGGVAVNYYIRI